MKTNMNLIRIFQANAPCYSSNGSVINASITVYKYSDKYVVREINIVLKTTDDINLSDIEHDIREELAKYDNIPVEFDLSL